MIDLIPGMLPAEVDSYDEDARTCRVRIPGLTDGSSVLPEAVIMPPIGDRSYATDGKDHTELRILPGDPVWVMFEGGDPRFPIIMGARTKRAGNPTGWRRWRHANIEMTADNELVINAAKVTWNVSGDVIENIGGSQTTAVTGALGTTAGTSTLSAGSHAITAATSITGNVALSGGTATHNGTNFGATHTHTEHDGFTTSAPN